jgi:hypothetical protein
VSAPAPCPQLIATFHAFGPKIVRATWSLQPVLAHTALLNSMLCLDGTLKKKLAAKIQLLPEEAQASLLYDVVAHYLSANQPASPEQAEAVLKANEVNHAQTEE